MPYYLISITGHGPDDGYTLLLNGARKIADRKYILATNDDINVILDGIRQIPGDAQARVITTEEYEALSHDILRSYAPPVMDWQGQ